MQIEGTIVDVFETWPLQLSVETQAGRYHVSLQHDTKIVFQGHSESARALKSRRRVRITGSAAGPDSLQAEEIEILS